MLKIAVCDDDQAVRRQVCGYLKGLCGALGAEEFSIEQFSSGQALLDHWPAGLDMLFMDIQMPGLNGIETAREIRRFDENVTLIFMTNFAQYAVSGYAVQAYNFLLKPLREAAFEREILPVLRRLSVQSGQCVTFKNETDYYTLRTRDVVYAETSGKSVIIHAASRDIRVADSMKNVQKQLPGEDFFRIHTGYLINMDMVTAIERDTVTLKTGQQLQISKHRKRAFLDAYVTHVGRRV